MWAKHYLFMISLGCLYLSSFGQTSAPSGSSDSPTTVTAGVFEATTAAFTEATTFDEPTASPAGTTPVEATSSSAGTTVLSTKTIVDPVESTGFSGETTVLPIDNTVASVGTTASSDETEVSPADFIASVDEPAASAAGTTPVEATTFPDTTVSPINTIFETTDRHFPADTTVSPLDTTVDPVVMKVSSVKTSTSSTDTAGFPVETTVNPHEPTNAPPSVEAYCSAYFRRGRCPRSSKNQRYGITIANTICYCDPSCVFGVGGFCCPDYRSHCLSETKTVPNLNIFVTYPSGIMNLFVGSPSNEREREQLQQRLKKFHSWLYEREKTAV